MLNIFSISHVDIEQTRSQSYHNKISVVMTKYFHGVSVCKKLCFFFHFKPTNILMVCLTLHACSIGKFILEPRKRTRTHSSESMTGLPNDCRLTLFFLFMKKWWRILNF